MKIEKLYLKNFRGYKSLELKIHSNFNLIIGENGSGKTALLEALTIAIGSFFLGIKNIDAKGIQKKDIRIGTFEFSEEYQFPVEVKVDAKINESSISWIRTLNGLSNRTTTIQAKKISQFAEKLQKSISLGTQEKLPLLAYYATGRLFDEAKNTQNLDILNDSNKKIASRFRAYDRCLEAKSTHKKFLSWFKAKEISRIQKRQNDIALELVQHAIIANLPNCKSFYYEFDPDKPQGLKVEFLDGRILPFNHLSDGTRNFFALISDIAYKAITLNPHLQQNALIETEGIVLIDELDLHLHPEWQKKIVSALKNTFPNIQFICTTHSPFIIQATEDNELLIINNNQIEENNSAVNLSIEDIAEFFQDVKNPQWSKKRQELFKLAPQYYAAIRNGQLTEDLNQRFNEAVKPFTMDTALFSVMKEEEIVQQYLSNKKK